MRVRTHSCHTARSCAALHQPASSQEASRMEHEHQHRHRACSCVRHRPSLASTLSMDLFLGLESTTEAPAPADFQRRPPAAFPIGVVRSGARRDVLLRRRKTFPFVAPPALYSCDRSIPRKVKMQARASSFSSAFFSGNASWFLRRPASRAGGKKPGRTSAAATGRPAGQ